MHSVCKCITELHRIVYSLPIDFYVFNGVRYGKNDTSKRCNFLVLNSEINCYIFRNLYEKRNKIQMIFVQVLNNPFFGEVPKTE